MSYVANVKVYISFGDYDEAKDETREVDGPVEVYVLKAVLRNVLDFSTAVEAVTSGLEGATVFQGLAASVSFDIKSVEEVQ